MTVWQRCEAATCHFGLDPGASQLTAAMGSLIQADPPRVGRKAITRLRASPWGAVAAGPGARRGRGGAGLGARAGAAFMRGAAGQATAGRTGRATHRGRVPEDDRPISLVLLRRARLKWGRALTNTPRSSGSVFGVHFRANHGQRHDTYGAPGRLPRCALRSDDTEAI